MFKRVEVVVVASALVPGYRTQLLLLPNSPFLFFPHDQTPPAGSQTNVLTAKQVLGAGNGAEQPSAPLHFVAVARCYSPQGQRAGSFKSTRGTGMPS